METEYKVNIFIISIVNEGAIEFRPSEHRDRNVKMKNRRSKKRAENTKEDSKEEITPKQV